MLRQNRRQDIDQMLESAFNELSMCIDGATPAGLQKMLRASNLS